jgi:beta-lactamase superfamily II metal-dependent hydrolase/alpha-beta hydrolase superfamily lysophospholipase
VLVFYAMLGLAAVVTTTTARHAKPTRFVRFSRNGAWLLTVVGILPGWLLSDVAVRAATLEAEFLAVGHGLAVLLHTPDGQTLLYDCGRLGDPTVGRRIVAPALWARGKSRIDTVFLSHADQDHYDGLPDLLDRFPIREVRLPPGFAGVDNPMAIRLLDQLRARGIPVRPITAPESWEKADVSFTVWHPPDGWHPETSDNARSLVLDVAFAGRHLLLTGDLEQLGLDLVVAHPPPEPPPDVFLAPHHGGKSANPEWLYQWAKPRLVVVSQRPLPARTGDALAHLERRGVPLLRTWRHGSIRLQWTDHGITARGFLDKGPEPDRDPDLSNIRRNKLWSDNQLLVSSTSFPSSNSQSAPRTLIGFLGFALGAISCLALAVIEFGAWVLVAPPRTSKVGDFQAVDGSTSEQERLVEPIEVRASDGARLAGRWLAAPLPIITGRTAILLHGFAEASSALEARRAAALNRHGWNVAVLDSRGYGQSDGPYATFGGREAGDIRAWLDSLSERLARIDPSLHLCPVLWGRSMGAAIALRATAAEQRVVALVLESPMVDLDASMTSLLRRRRVPFPNLMARLITRRAGKLAKVPIHRPRPIDSAQQVTCPTLIVHGTNDTIVAIDEARRLADAFPAPPHWIEVPDARHTDVVDQGGEPLLDRIAAFLDEAAGNIAAPAETRGAS